MTFEEFFQKKKIDLAALGKERRQLLEELQKHFQAMGEKSFDHTKKYWFNKLRKSYPLKEEAVKPKVSPAPAPDAKTVEAPSKGAEAPKPNLGFKPRFKAGKTVVTSGEKEQAPMGKEQTPGQKEQAPPETEKDPEETPSQAPKPAYKPRFKPGITPRQKE